MPKGCKHDGACDYTTRNTQTRTNIAGSAASSQRSSPRDSSGTGKDHAGVVPKAARDRALTEGTRNSPPKNSRSQTDVLQLDLSELSGKKPTSRR